MDAVKELNKQDQQQEEKKPFAITDEAGLQWAAQKIEEHRQEARKWADMQQTAVNYYQDKENAELAAIDNLMGLVREYATKQMNDKPGWKFDGSPFMRIVRQTHKPKLVQDNHDALIKQFAGTDYVQSKPKLDWSALKKDLKFNESGVVFTKDGELVDGAKVVKKPDTIAIKHKSASGSWTTSETK